MSFQSLHSKIFALVTAILAAIAIVVMLTSQRNVTDTVMTSEQHAISNVLDLIQHDAAARWGAMLNNKVSIVRNGRRQLMQTGKLIEATLESYARLADEGFITKAMAQDLAREWINQLHFDGDRYAFVFDTRYIVLASGYPAMRGRDLSSINDYKNRPLAQSSLEESRDSGYSFAIYRRPTSTEPAGRIQQDFQALVGDDDNSRYAYFDYFGPWNWVLAVSDSAADVIEQIEEYRTQMENAVRTTLLPMKLAHSGFVFIVADDGRFVVAPPDTHHGFLDNRFDDGQTLRQRLNAPTRANLHGLQVDGSRGPWKIDSAHYAPLHWTIVAAVPENDLSAPARKLLRSQALIFGAMSLAALLSAWFFAARIVQPLKRLTSYARQLPDQALRVEGNVPHHIAALPDQHRDEVGRLATAFMYMDSKLRENIHHDKSKDITHAYCFLSNAPATHRDAFFAMLLQAHMFGAATDGCMFGFEPQQDQVILFKTISLADLDSHAAIAQLEALVNQAGRWAAYLPHLIEDWEQKVVQAAVNVAQALPVHG
ncbi:Single Cache domain-containing protein [Bordetella tumbae]|uniref:cache domain-containing protein n=1 Tax=Bordetella tumbae TaxID=1649139 RepID=UPI0039F0D523